MYEYARTYVRMYVRTYVCIHTCVIMVQRYFVPEFGSVCHEFLFHHCFKYYLFRNKIQDGLHTWLCFATIIINADMQMELNHRHY